MFLVHTKVFGFILFGFIWLCLTAIPHDAFSFLLLIIVPFFILNLSVKTDSTPNLFYFKLSSLKYVVRILKEIILSTIGVIKIVWKKRLILHPVITTIESVEMEDLGIVLYANSITLTPGTVTIDVKGNCLTVHALDVSLIDELKEGDMDKVINQMLSKC